MNKTRLVGVAACASWQEETNRFSAGSEKEAARAENREQAVGREKAYLHPRLKQRCHWDLWVHREDQVQESYQSMC